MFLLLLAPALALAQGERPNVLWITTEDHGPHVGAYGDSYATTPNIDALAAKGMLYRHAWSTAPVCAPARTTLISGVYPPSTGSEHMRSMTRLPASMKMYPQYLRDAGYYATNNSKEDYNLEQPGQVWDESSNRAHWRNRPAGRPFFAIFNFTESHESQIRTRPHAAVHDPEKVRIPAYHPDTPEVRQDWAQYYDKITEIDAKTGQVLRELEEDGLAEETIVFFYSDHGSGMPRSKRWPYNSGLQVPLIVHFPEKWRHLAGPDYRPGGESSRLVGFIDLPPTLLSLVGIQPPGHMQGYAFLGEYVAPEQPYIYGFRGRMDERYDMVRSIRDRRYIYIRSYMPHKIYGQHINYMFQTPTTRIWKELFDQGKLDAAQSAFWKTKPAEELYDLESDPDEVKNLAGSGEHRQILERMREALYAWQVKIRDVGFLPEGEIHSRAGEAAPYEMGHDDYRYPMRRVMESAQVASTFDEASVGAIRRAFDDPDSAVRYWAAMGALMRERRGVDQLRPRLAAALDDDSPYVRIVAAEALGRFGRSDETSRALEVLMPLAPIDENGLYISLMALNAIEAMGGRAARVRSQVAALPREAPGVHQRLQSYVPRLIESIAGE